ncbi:tensin-2 [Alligator sinensis]|uniref:Tensin-2 n=1 Tax=Alligator sinensis TaxID=38654 RepID=A0A3Q0HC74_ALLSI|nr:tensin-2 [Alligator sinensis]
MQPAWASPRRLRTPDPGRPWAMAMTSAPREGAIVRQEAPSCRGPALPHCFQLHVRSHGQAGAGQQDPAPLLTGRGAAQAGHSRAMKPRDTLDVLFRVLGRRGSARAPGTCRPGKGPEPHSFREKVFKKKHRACAACKEPVEAQGLICKVCKIASHRKCEAKVTSSCQPAPPPELRRNTAPARRIEHLGSTKSLNTGKQRSTLPRSFSLDQVMERAYDLDLTYITERIISVFFPPGLEEQRYRGHLREVAQMLKSKHEDKYTLFNLSEKRHDIARLNPKVQEFGWPDGHAPPLDRICSICKAMESWLHAHPQHVAVLHCKGNKGKTGVIVAAYMHYSKISASPDQALSTLAMRKFCEDKVSAALQPSQRRYINYFSGLLSGAIKMNSHTLFLHHVRVPALPAFEARGGYQPFLKIYQSMQLERLTLGSLTGPGTQKLCITLEPALLLKGDVMVKCYHRQSHGAERDVVFRVQFHTCTVHGSQLWFSKDELDEAWTDERFPFEASVEFIFSSGPEKIKGWEAVGNGPGVSVDYNISEPAVRWDSYESFNVHHEDSLEDLSHTQGPLDGSLYARVQKKRSLPGPVGSASPESPPLARGLLSVSSDSGHSSMLTERADEATPPARALPTPAEREELDRLLDGFGVPSPRAEPDCLPGNGARTRETAILDDEATPGPYPMRRRGLARHCSCHAGYLGTASPERPPTSIGYRPEGTLERRRPAYSANGLPLRPDGFELPQPGSASPDGTHGYEPPGMEPGDGYLRPGSMHPELPPPGEGAPWRDVPDGPGSLRRPPREPCSPCLAPPSLPEPPAPLHTSSPVQSQDSTTYGTPESPVPPSPADMAPSSATRTLERPPASSAGASASGSPPPTSPAPRSPFASYRAAATLRATPAHNGPPQAEPRPGTLPRCSSGSPLSTQPPASPDAQGSPTPAFPLATAYYTGRESSLQPQPQPPLPEKRHAVPAGLWERSPLPSRSPGAPAHVSFAPDATTPDPQAEGPGHIQFVQDTSKFWYKPSLSRDQAIALLKDKEPGAFLIRDSNSFQGAYGLALKVATPPPNCAPHSSKGDPMEQLVRHFLIETGSKGVKIKGCQDEPHFGSLPALVSQHAITPISLPCRLRIPSKDPTEESPEVAVPANMSTAADLLRQGAACSVLYLSSVETESLTGPQAVAKAASSTLACNPRPPAAPVHFKVSAQGITLTDSQRKLFFRRHYPVSSVTYCSTDPQDRRWTNPDGTTSKLFGFVAKKQGSPCENVCHVFAELDPEQPAAAIVNFITKVLLGLHRK